MGIEISDIHTSMKTPLAVVFLLSVTVALAREAPQTLGEQMERDNPAMIAYLQKLTDADVGKKLKGTKLSDGAVELKGSTYLGSLINTAKKQHIYTFRTDGFELSYVWIDKGGKSLTIPHDLNDPSGEHAGILSGDIYTYPIVEPGDGVVVLYGGTLKWLNAQKSGAKK